MDLANELERELSFSRASAEGKLLDYDDAISRTSSDPAASALLVYTQEEQMFEGEEVEIELSQSSCPTYEELLEVMERATGGLTCRGSEPWWWRHGGVSMSGTFLAITPQSRWAFHFFRISIRRLRRNGKSCFPLASIDSSIPVMLTLKGCVKAAMRGYPL